MMTTKNPEDSVRDEQFDGTEKSAESLEETTTGDDVTARPADAAGAVGNDEIPAEAAEANDSSEAPVAGENVDGEPAEVSPEPEEKREVRETAESSDPEAGEIAETTGDTDEAEDIADATGDTDEAEDIADATGDSDEAEDIADITGDSDEAVEQVEERINYDDIELPPVDYSGFSRKELVETLALIVENRPPAEILDDVNRIKEFFYKKTKAEFNEKRLNFAKEGGNIEEYRPEPDELENRIKTILETYRNRRSDFNRIQESEKQENLRRKVEIIEQIKDLVNREEAINKTFQEFRNLQNEWHATGIVPQSAVKDLWETY
ncbi:MAG: DUF349 domain-containing protein, partial [Actinomycetota bacterium]